MKRTPLVQSLIHQVQTWFSQAKQQATEPEDVLKDAPDELLLELEALTQELPVPPAYQDAIHQALTKAVRRWQDSPEAENHLVLMSPPCEPLARILTTVLKDWSGEDLEILHPLQDFNRPADPLAIPAQLRNALENRQEDTEDDTESDSEDPEPADKRQILVVPALEHCFLRAIQGWQGVEYLQNLVVQDTSRFWVIGCTSWSWAFLDRVCHVSAYLEQIESLPELSGEDLQPWLEPLIQRVDKTLPEESSCADQTPWDALAKLSRGNSAIAAQLWINALGVRHEDLPDPDDPDDQQAPVPLHSRKPILPNLPSLTPIDRHLLQSLLIHNRMTRSHLSLSLGESETIVRSRAQLLHREEVILRRRGYFSINPVHYPRLRSELGSNNFLVGES
ncbi:hypothetical protein C7271_17875 [filamentous cyanobacterium CCP5]|nr:hypothetical protein C7271_17875 [filamentous cyanobacterium CCP5]